MVADDDKRAEFSRAGEVWAVHFWEVGVLPANYANEANKKGWPAKSAKVREKSREIIFSVFAGKIIFTRPGEVFRRRSLPEAEAEMPQRRMALFKKSKPIGGEMERQSDQKAHRHHSAYRTESENNNIEKHATAGDGIVGRISSISAALPASPWTIPMRTERGLKR